MTAMGPLPKFNLDSINARWNIKSCRTVVATIIEVLKVTDFVLYPTLPCHCLCVQVMRMSALTFSMACLILPITHDKSGHVLNSRRGLASMLGGPAVHRSGKQTLHAA